MSCSSRSPCHERDRRAPSISVRLDVATFHHFLCCLIPPETMEGFQTTLPRGALLYFDSCLLDKDFTFFEWPPSSYTEAECDGEAFRVCPNSKTSLSFYRGLSRLEIRGSTLLHFRRVWKSGSRALALVLIWFTLRISISLYFALLRR
jgi:hypothetical protein